MDRASYWKQVEDLADAPRYWVDDFHLGDYVPTWAGICYVMGRLKGASDWDDYCTFAKRYQVERLGRRSGETFLTEVLPLPKPTVNAWPYGSLWPTKRAYEEEVRPGGPVPFLVRDASGDAW